MSYGFLLNTNFLSILRYLIIIGIYIFLFIIVSPSLILGNGPGMVLILGGKIKSDNSKIQISLDNFYIDSTEVTQKQFTYIMGFNKFFFKGDNHPAEQVNWFKAKAYCQKVGKRLPTEPEWELAARGGTNTLYFWGNKPDGAFASYGGDYDLGHHPVGRKKPNPFGLYDTAGNVWEWTSTAINDRNKFSGNTTFKRIVKGGSFNVSANLVTPSSRMKLTPKSRLFNVGFRCAK